MKKIFIIIAILYIIGIVIYELLYIKQKHLDVLSTIGIPEDRINAFITQYENEFNETMEQSNNAKKADFLKYIKKRTNTTKTLSIVNGLGAVALNLIPYVGPILSVAAATAGKVAADNEMKNIDKKVKEGY